MPKYVANSTTVKQEKIVFFVQTKQDVMHTTRFILTTFSVFLLYFLPSPAQTVTMAPGQDKQYLKMINPEDIEPVPGYQIVYGKLNGLDAARTSRGYFVVGSVVYVDENLNATVLTAQTNLLNDDKDGPVRLERIRYAKNPYYQRFSIPGGHTFNTFVIVPGKTAKDTKILSFKKHGIPQKCTRNFRYVLEDENGTRTFVCWYNKDKKAYMDWLDEDGKVLERKEFLKTIADEKSLIMRSPQDSLWRLYTSAGKEIAGPFKHYPDGGLDAFYSWESTRNILNENDFWLLQGMDGKWGILTTDGQSQGVLVPMEYDNIGFWKDLPDVFVLAKDGKTGLYTRDYKPLFAEKFDYLTFTPFEPEFSGTLKLPKAFIACRDGKYGMIDRDGNVLIPFEYSEGKERSYLENVLARIYPEASFKVFMENHYSVTSRDEFETVADFKARIEDPQKQKAYLSRILPVAEKAFVKEFLAKEGAAFILSSYDAASETFTLSHNLIYTDTYRIPVPRGEAPQFKLEFSLIQEDALKGAEFFVDHDNIALKKASFVTSDGHTYTFQNPHAL